MSKKPPKPNTSPEHVKETAEAYTCPTEARERLEAELRNIANSPMAETDHALEFLCTPEEARTLLATPTQGPADQFADAGKMIPTQEGVGREEIAPVRRIEMVPWDHPFSDEKVEPVWDLEIGGFVAQFPTETSANNFRNAILSLLSPTERANPGARELRSALEGFDDDYMTSETHHPGYVLIPTEKFERIRAILSLLPAPKLGEGAEPGVKP